MISKVYRKRLLLVTKIGIAALLLAWVLGKVHLRDYVVAEDGRSFDVVQNASVLDASREVRGSSGSLWWRQEMTLSMAELRPIPNVKGADPGTVEKDYVRAGFISSIRQVKLILLVLAAFGMLPSILIGSVRWRYLLLAQGIHIKRWEVLRLTVLGLFFNSFVIGTWGGDLVKAYYAAKHTDRKGAVLLSVVFDRFLGLVTSAAIAAVVIGILFVGQVGSSGEIWRAVMTVSVVLLVMFIGVLFLFGVRFRRLLCLERIYHRLPFARHVASAARAVKTYRDSPGAMLKAMGLSLIAQVFGIGSIALIGYSLSLPIPWYYYFAYVPLICTIGAVPLTPGGVGVVENLYVAFFAAVSPSSIMVLALLVRLLPLLWSLPGLAVAVTGPRLPEAGVMQAALSAESGTA